MKFFVIGDEDTVLGFSLVGVEGVVVRDADAARQLLDRSIERQDIGIILITERIAALIRSEVDNYFYRTPYPLIIEIPDRLGPIETRISLKEAVQTAVGVRME